MATNNYDLILRFIMDQSSHQKTKAGVDALTSEIGEVDKVLEAVNKDFDTLDKKIKEATSVKELDSLERQLKDVENQVNETTKAYSLQAKVLRAEAASLTSDFEKARLAQIKSIGDRIGGASSRALITGGAILGGAFAESNRFAKEAEDTGKATRATREWTQATQELAQARARVDTVLLRETLPLLKQAAKVANEAAAFVEKNPEIVSAALKTGEVLVALGAVGVAVSKGIRLYADVQALALGAQQLTAAKLQDDAADKQLIAARLRAGVSGADVPGGGGGAPAAGGLSTAVSFATSVAVAVLAAGATAGAVKLLIDKISPPSERSPQTAIPSFSTNGLGNPEFRRKQVELANAISRGDSPEKIAQLRVELKALGQQIFETAKQVRQGTQQISEAIQSGGLAGSAHEAEIVSAFQQWKEDDARLVQEAADKRVQIIADSEKRVVAETQKYASQVASINASADKRAQSLTSNFLKAEAQDEVQYQEQRAQIIRDGGKDIREIEEDHQKRIREMTKEHNERVEDLTASRDALGLVKEQRRFNEQQAEENRNTRIEIAKRRQDLAERLAELDHEHEVEKAQRLAQFQEALAENEAQRKEQLKQAAEAHAEEMAQIRAQRAQQLRELQESLNAERLRRREVFIAEVRDLDAALLGEKNLKARYYALMLADAEKFLAALRTKMASATTGVKPPGSAAGGYVGYGTRLLGEEGREFVLSNRTTRAAENIIGSGLTQDALLSALARSSGSQRSLTIQDNSRFDGRISSSQVQGIKREIRNQLVKDFLGG